MLSQGCEDLTPAQWAAAANEAFREAKDVSCDTHGLIHGLVQSQAHLQSGRPPSSTSSPPSPVDLTANRAARLILRRLAQAFQATGIAGDDLAGEVS